jgi:hypothetical protein
VLISSADPRVGWRGISALAEQDGLTQPWRVDDDVWLQRMPLLRERAGMPAGVRWEFTASATSEMRIDVEAGPECSPVDVQVLTEGADAILRIPLAEGHNRLVISVSSRSDGASQAVRIWWPQYGTVRIGQVGVFGHPGGPEPSIAPTPSRRIRWTAYGSSITQCRTAPGPTETWPALVALANDWDLRCLGFGGQAHLDPVVARSIRDHEADFISLCVGVNIQGAASLSERTLGPALAEFVRTIREGQPQTPLVVSSPICCPDREDAPNAVGLSLSDVRRVVHRTIESLRREGDTMIEVIDGLTILAPGDAGLLEDGLHPDPEGYRLMATRFTPALDAARRRLTGARGSASADANTQDPDPELRGVMTR